MECLKEREEIKKAVEEYNAIEAFPMTELNLIILKNNHYLKHIYSCKDKGIYKFKYLPDNQIKVTCSFHDKFNVESIDEDNIDDDEISIEKDDIDDIDDDIEIDLD